MADRPSDLIPLDEAARRVDRSRSTLRGWIRSGALSAWREDPDHPENTRQLVSLGALMQLVVVSQKAARPGRPGRPQDGATQAALAEEHARLRRQLEGALAARIEALEGRVADLEVQLARTERWRDDWAARAQAAEAERDRLRARAGRRWWWRLLGSG
jgi:hypothetical protein